MIDGFSWGDCLYFTFRAAPDDEFDAYDDYKNPATVEGWLDADG